jgi:PKD repeat protein
VYRVTLTASRTGETDTTTRYNYIQALPLTGPFTIQAEDYDEGGPNVAFSDTTPGNQGGAYRNDDVDIETFGRGYVIAQIYNGEWTRYTIPSAAAEDHDYNLTLRVATRTTGEQVTVNVDGFKEVVVDLPNTGSLTNYVDVPARVTLRPGTNTVRFTYDAAYTNFDYFTLDPGEIDPLQPVGGGLYPPNDLHLDGSYDDVNGNGRADFADIVLYFNQMSWIAANEPMSAFDYNGNSRIDFADVVWLFNNL